MAQDDKKVESRSPVSKLSDPYVSINGVYGEGSVITNKDGKLTVTMGKRPTASGYYNAPVIVGSGSVDFPDDARFSFTFDGKQIRWSNNTQWDKKSIDGNWIDNAQNEISVKSGDDGELVITWVNGKRPISYGNFNIITNKGYVRFIDDAKFSFVFDGDNIQWNNNTSWKRK